MIIYYLLIFMLGLIVGSFLNCVIYRLEAKKSFLKGRSFCPHCKHSLTWFDLIPLFSFIFLRRHCRYCKKTISWQYPIVETITGLLFVLIFWHLDFGFSRPEFVDGILAFNVWYFDFLTLLFLLTIIPFLIIIFVYDLKHFIILDKVLIPAIILTTLYRIIESIFNNQPLIINYFCASFLAAGFFLLIYLISKGKWIGFADIKLAFLLGIILGWPEIAVSLFLSFLIGGIMGVGLIMFSGKKLKSEVPFAPFLITGTLITLFWGQGLINWYYSLIF